MRHLYLLVSQSSLRFQSGPAPPNVHQRGQVQVHVCRFLSCTRLSSSGGIWSHSLGRSKSLILLEEQVAALADCPPAIRDNMCFGVISKSESGNNLLHTAKRHGSARVFVGTDYISLSQPDMGYLVRVFHILKQKFIITLFLATRVVLRDIVLSFDIIC